MATLNLGGLFGSYGGGASMTVTGRRMKIGGRTYTGTVSIVRGRVLVDGKPVEGDDGIDPDAREIVVTVEGPCEKIDLSVGEITVEGDAGRVSTASGDVHVKGSVDGGVNTASGDVAVGGEVRGGVNTASGDIRRGVKRGRKG